MITKSTFRKTILQYRRLLEQHVFEERSKHIFQLLQKLIESKEVRKLHIFLTMKNNQEPDVFSFVKTLWEREVKVIVSRTDFDSKEMQHFSLKPETQLAVNKMGIPEPVNAEEASIENVDLILVPLLVCDREGYRIGYGGGYYDRLLLETKALKVGLSLSPPVDIILQREDWDIPLDYLITPFKTYNYG